MQKTSDLYGKNWEIGGVEQQHKNATEPQTGNEESNKVKNYWEEQGEKYANTSYATTPDKIAFDLETKEILKNISDGQKIINIGCGNGIKDIAICQNKKVELRSLDYSENMVQAARENYSNSKDLIGNATFGTGNILELNIEGKFDVAITVRCLINLANHEQHILAIKNILNILKAGGTYLMFENTKDALKKLMR